MYSNCIEFTTINTNLETALKSSLFPYMGPMYVFFGVKCTCILSVNIYALFL